MNRWSITIFHYNPTCKDLNTFFQIFFHFLSLSLNDELFAFNVSWSFGVVLWEIFTLGEHPFNEYRGFNELINALKNNIRLPKPNYASDKMYLFSFSTLSKVRICQFNFSVTI